MNPIYSTGRLLDKLRESPAQSNAERQRAMRERIEQDRVAAEARARLSSLPPGTLDREPKPVLTGDRGSR